MLEFNSEDRITLAEIEKCEWLSKGEVASN